MADAHESIEYGINEVRELHNTVVHKGTITSVDTDNDKCDLANTEFGTLAGVDIFFHCPGEDSVAGGSKAFKEDDEVIVVSKNALSGSFGGVEHRVVGLWYGDIPKCIGDFTFILTRDDGTPVDDTMLDRFKLYKTFGHQIVGCEWEYLGEGKWTVNIVDKFPDPNDLYWMEYEVLSPTIEISTQYPFRYKEVDKENLSDRITPREEPYVDHVPYYEVEREWDLYPVKYEDLPYRANTNRYGNCYSPQYYEYRCWDDPTIPDVFRSAINFNLATVKKGKWLEWRAVIKSSIPYEIRMKAIRGSTADRFIYGGGSACLCPLGCPSTIAVYCSTCYAAGITVSNPCQTPPATINFTTGENCGGPGVTTDVSDGIVDGTYLDHSTTGDMGGFDTGYIEISSPSILGKEHYFKYSCDHTGTLEMKCNAADFGDPLDCKTGTARMEGFTVYNVSKYYPTGAVYQAQNESGIRFESRLNIY